MRKENRYEDALTQLNELLALIESTESPDQKRIASVHSYLADVYIDSASFEEAKRVQEVALGIHTKLIPDSWVRYSTEAKMGRILLELDELSRAEALLVSGFRGMEKQKESIHPSLKEILPNTAKALARLYEKKGEHEKVKQWKRKQTQLELETVSSSAAQKGGR